MGINRSEKLFEFVICDVETMCRKQGTKVEVQRFSYYDKEKYVLYLYNGDNGVYKISKDEIKQIKNGDDCVLFIHSQENKGFSLIEIDKDYFRDKIVNPINFEEEELGLSLEEQREIFEKWVYSLFFESILPTKPIMLFNGEMGSGKSCSLKIVGKILFGGNFNVTPLPNKADDLDSIVANSPFVVLDNVDSYKDWLNDKLACIATGQSIKKRELYTTNKMVEFEAKCFIAITSRTPKFTRDDVANRLIILNLKNLVRYSSEEVLTKEIMAYRDEIMSTIVYKLKDIITSLYETKDIITTTSLRMADYATFCLKIAESEGRANEMEAILQKLVSTQTNLAIEDDPLVSCLMQFVESPCNHQRELETSKLFNELKSIAECNKIAGFDYKNPRSLGKRLASLKDNLKGSIEFTKRKGNGNKAFYKFWLVKQDETENGFDLGLDFDDMV